MGPFVTVNWSLGRLKKVKAVLLLLFGAVLWLTAEGEARTERPTWRLKGGDGIYQTRGQDSLYSIAGRLGQRWEYLARLNELQPPFTLSIGQRLQINGRHLVPQTPIADGLLLNLPGHMLYLFTSGALVKKFPVAIGRPDWPTPEGSFTIVGKQKNPIWTVPKSIQEELRKEGRLVLDKVPPGPDNPLGKFWLPLSVPGYGIHSTIWPESIGHSTSHGCIRMLPEDIEELFPFVQIGSPVTIVYEPIKLAVLRQRQDLSGSPPQRLSKAVFLPGAPGRTDQPQQHLSDQVEWSKASVVLADQAGVAEDISRSEPAGSKRALK